MFRIIVILILISVPIYNYGAALDIEAGLTTRSYGGAAGDSVNYSRGYLFSFHQNRLLFYNSDLYQITSGLDFNYHAAKSDDIEIKFYQFGTSGVLSFERYFSKNGYKFFYPDLILHGGYVRTSTITDLTNIESGGHNHLFTGIGAELNVLMGDTWGTKAGCIYDAHFMKGGIVAANSFFMSVFYRYALNKQ